MRRLPIFVISLLSVVLVFFSHHRVIVIALSTANLVALTSHASIYDKYDDIDVATPEQQADDVTQAVANPAISMGGSVVNGMVGGLVGGSQKKGLQFKDPVVSLGTTYRSSDDTSLGGFSGNEYSGDIGFDADIYDGLITGVLYQHTYRGASNGQGTSENLSADGVSVYAARRFFDLMNAGLAYNHVFTDHRLTRAVNTNLDRDSDGAIAFVGTSDRNGNWSWNTTTSFTYVRDNYERQRDLDTMVFTWGGGLDYDVTKIFTLGAAFNYNNLVVQNFFDSSTVARDDDFWTLGPRLRFYPTDNVTVRLDFESMQGYTDYRAYSLRLGMNIAF